MTPSSAKPIASRVDPYFKDYASYHRTKGNQITHMVGIPMIVVAVLGLLANLPILGGVTGSDYFRLDAGTLLWAVAVIWYLVLNWKLALPFSLVSAACYFFGRALPTPVLWGLFVVGWIVQFIGHGVYEKKSPAFFKNLLHLLIGPLWVFAKIVGYSPR